MTCVFWLLLLASAPPPPAQAAEWADILALTSVYEQAINSTRIDRLRPYVSSDFFAVLVTGEEARSLDELAERIANIRARLGPGGAYSVKIRLEPGIIEGNVAIATGTAEETVVMGGVARFVLTSRFLANLRREGGVWKLHRFAAAIDPFNNVVVRRTLELNRVLFASGGALVGALVGLFLGRRSFRART